MRYILFAISKWYLKELGQVGGGEGWLISLYQLSKVMPLRVDIWRKFVIGWGCEASN